MKKAGFMLALAVLLLLALSPAWAEQRGNPRWEHIQQTLVWQQKALKGQPPTRGVSVSVRCSRTPTLTEDGEFIASIQNGGAGSYVLEFGIEDLERDEGYIYFSNPTPDLTFSGVSLYAGGRYRLWVFLYAAGDTENSLAYTWLDFTVEGDTQTLNTKAAEIVNMYTGSDAWQTALKLHDWLTHNAYYDTNYEYYGTDIILRGYGVCDSYSKAFSLLCQTAGINVIRVTGKSGGGGRHAWNMIELDGSWYQVDVTWDDPVGGPLTAVSGYEGHDYFCLNDALMNMDHIPEKPAERPACNSLDANYYIHENQWEVFGMDVTWDSEMKPVMVSRAQYFEEALNAGNTYFSLEWTQRVTDAEEGGVYWVQSVSPKEYVLFAYGLSKRVWQLSDGNSVLAAAGHEAGSSSVYLKVTGWDIQETGSLVLPADTEAIGDEAFRFTGATTLVLPDHLTSIGPGAFAYSAVRTVYIPENVQIDSSAFEGCQRLIFVTSETGSSADYAREHNCLILAP